MSRAQVWQALNDPQVLKSCLPGCERLSRREDGIDGYDAALVVKVGPIKARFDGRVGILESNGRDRMVLDGAVQGGLAGFAKGKNSIELIELDAQTTELRYAIGVEMGGRMASLGAKAVEPVVRRQAGLFFEKLVVAAAPEGPAGAASAEADVPPAQTVVALTSPVAAAGAPTGGGPADWLPWMQRERREGLLIGFWLGAATTGAALWVAGILGR